MMAILRTTVVLLNVFLLVRGALPGGDCVEPCINEMQRSLEATPMLRHEHLGQLSFTQLVGATQNDDVTAQSFTAICKAYITVDECLAQCEKSSENSGRIRETYAGIRFICIEHRKEFFDALPCLAKQESLAMTECRREINESLVASNRFSLTVMKKEHHNLRTHFETLCRKLGSMIECVEPVTRKGCGDQAALMMLKFITVGFSSFEQLYSQLGISDQLPASCKSLLSLKRRVPLQSGVGLRERQPQLATRSARKGMIYPIDILFILFIFSRTLL